MGQPQGLNSNLSVCPSEILICLEASANNSRSHGPGQSKLEKDVLFKELQQVNHSKES